METHAGSKNSLINKQTEIALFVSHAIYRKYNSWTFKDTLNYVKSVLQKMHNLVLSNDDELDIDKDIIKQYHLYKKLEKLSKNSDIHSDLLLEINSLARGIEDKESLWRQSEWVADFGGDAMVPISDINKCIQPLNNKIQEAFLLTNGDKVTHSNLLGEIFSEIIRIHPFEDANGRTARFIILLLVLRWGYRQILIPKYRNDIVWRNALDDGMQGKFKNIQDYFFLKLEESSTG